MYPERDWAKDFAVEGWVAGHQAADLHVSAVGEAEMRSGVAALPAWRRREALALAIEAILREDFEDRVLPFDSAAAREYADIAASRRAAGHPVAPADCQIAAIALSRSDNRDAERSGLCRNGDRTRQSVGRRVSLTTEAFQTSTGKTLMSTDAAIRVMERA
ncbi:MAG: PIN domain-containing protein [Rhodobacteraceae bacterium]|nr:PIN domain-containing protein [Paracoccaceae bacterium]